VAFISYGLKARLVVQSLFNPSIRPRLIGASKFRSAMLTTSTAASLIDFLRHSYPSIISPTTSEEEIPQLSHTVFPQTSYTDNEKVETSQWLTTSARLAASGEDEAKHAERLGSLNIHLSTRTTLLGSKPSIADVALFYRLAPAVRIWSPEERTGEHGYHHIVRFIDFVQNAPLFGLSLKKEEKVDVNVNDVKFVQKPIDPKEEKERKRKEKAAAAVPSPDANEQKPLVVGRKKERDADPKTPKNSEIPNPPLTSTSNPQSSKKEKKEKAPKAPKGPKPPAEAPFLSPSAIDLRVGHIIKAIPHPNADSLYVSTIACGDPPDTPNTSIHENQVVRTVCSGLNGLIPLSEMQNRKIVAVCNLKPVTMRGIKSAAMVLAASPRLAPGEEDMHKGPVELVQVPDDAVAGERIYFEGWDQGEPEAVLNPKKKVWETLQPGFTTTDGLDVGFDPGTVEALKDSAGDKRGIGKLRTKGGYCTVRSLTGAVVR
jgi:aminoacyl tRNA synthase complex-interacting multifunctional protein 1